MCGCQRTTYLCQCRHKERRVERCHVHYLRKQGSCWAWCFPNCRTTVLRYRIQRVCRECDSYFYEKYGEQHYNKFIQLFLEYKETKGWGKTVIDPRTVPREVLLKRQPLTPRIGDQTEELWRGYGHGIRQGQGQPFQVHQPMIELVDMVSLGHVPSTTPHIRYQGERRPTPVANYDNRYPGPAAGVSRQPNHVNPGPARIDPKPAPIEREGTPFPHERTPSPNSEPDSAVPRFVPKVSGASIKQAAPLYILNKDKPLPPNSDLFVVGNDDDYEDEDMEKARVFTPSPVPKYHTNKLPTELTVVPELAHLALGRAKYRHRRSRSFSEIEQPTPRMGKAWKGIRNVDSLSDISLVKKLTKVARNIKIPNLEYIEYNGKWIPRVMTPPRGRPRTRTPTPSPPLRDAIANWRPYSHKDTQSIDIAISANAVKKVDRQDSGPSAYYVVARPDADSPTGASARVRHSPSHESVVVPPPQHLDGVLVPSASGCPHHHDQGIAGECMICRGSFFKERGLPSETYIQQECRSATLAQQSPMLVSIRKPERRYSCAVQACYFGCDGDNECPSCRARNRIAKKLQMTWI
ncbi:hypothetical protein E0Z10_g6126 [Xylaria hypoxylon]|uniref:Uncharacterized protein n=1 Tax=Xylaria hypoxylon TaxID=37992 RepID=A0A4Z0YTA0_9PEZI|nr:hypothetical protein E0Z10_g6126 [Xylaria hypoxylon]